MMMSNVRHHVPKKPPTPVGGVSLIIPLFGIQDALLLIAFVKVLSGAMILSAIKFKKSSIINL